ARRARSARSPSGSTGSCWLLAAGGPQFRLGRGRFLVGGPDALARAGDVGRNALRLFGDMVEGLAQPQVGAQGLVAASLSHACDRLVGIVAVRLRLLADQLLDLLVGNLEAELVGDRFENELAGDGLLRFGAQVLDELVAGLAGELEI